MNSIWQSHLQSYNAVIENGCVTHYNNITSELESTRSGIVVIDLSHFGLILFSGKDAQAFLQGQLTCDVNKIDAQTAVYGSYCTPKGRMLASFLLWEDDGHYLMQLPLSLCPIIQKRLAMFVLRDQVQLTDGSGSLVRIGVAGNNARMLVAEIFDLELTAIVRLCVIRKQQVSIICHTQNRFELVMTVEQAPALWARLGKNAKPVGAACWDWLEIHSGIPIILPATQDQFIPQMTNLDAIEGVSFKKGCYPGQEIIARTHYLGKIKRRMYIANISTSMSVMAGDELFSVDMAEQSSGKIVNAAPSPNGGFDVLAVIQAKSFEAAKIHWNSLDGPSLEFMALPYSLK